MKSNYKKIGNFIQLVDERNAGHEVKNLLGLSISKQFIHSVANIIGTGKSIIGEILMCLFLMHQLKSRSSMCLYLLIVIRANFSLLIRKRKKSRIISGVML
jgi:hypothetical protein